MKFNIKILLCLLFFLLNATFSQNISVQNFIGKQQADVINTYGKPVHVDNTTPSMICLFYKVPNMVFVLDETGVYQAEIKKNYYTEKDARKELDEMIVNSIISGFDSDTLSTTDIILTKVGVQSEIRLVKNPTSEGFELNIKAVRHTE